LLDSVICAFNTRRVSALATFMTRDMRGGPINVAAYDHILCHKLYSYKYLVAGKVIEER
jgi:hypothetical protein